MAVPVQIMLGFEQRYAGQPGDDESSRRPTPLGAIEQPPTFIMQIRCTIRGKDGTMEDLRAMSLGMRKAVTIRIYGLKACVT